ncbi:MAG TPA: hydrogenase maturation protease [Sandaracinaceae bacterium LLY-WYZ-13_1]|nr:hydrogenase maturation protease [Sandaracinaceae bacterium LLY-WYZ-13_1]
MTEPPTERVRVIALGNELAGDDGAALIAARRLAERAPGLEVLAPGRPGPGLLELLDPDRPTVLMDVVRQGVAAGAILELPLDELATAAIDAERVSSHGLGVARALRLAEALDRPLPRGIFVGLGGRRFEPGPRMDPDVEEAIDDLVEAARAAAEALDAAE